MRPPMRPTDSRAYQHIDRPVAVMVKEYDAARFCGRHRHPRAQLVQAVDGLIVVGAESGSWVVPAGFALWTPAELDHDVTMHGPAVLRTIYIRPGAAPDLPADCRVIAVSALLDAALTALAEEPVLYDASGRGGHLAALVLDEIVRADATPFALPVPADPRLARLARALIADPGSALDIDGWAETVGVSRRTLTRLFRVQTGLSFGDWRRRLRLLRAATRMADGEPLARVAASLGYRSPAAFRAMARRAFGANAPSGVPSGPSRRDAGGAR